MPPKTLRNPKFKKECKTKISWTRVGRSGSGFPYRYRTVCCPDHLARTDDIVITIPILRGGRLVETAVIHQRCLASFMEKVPDDRTIIRERAQNIVNRFRRNKDEGTERVLSDVPQ